MVLGSCMILLDLRLGVREDTTTIIKNMGRVVHTNRVPKKKFKIVYTDY